MRDEESGFTREVRGLYQETASDDAARDRLLVRLRAAKPPRRSPAWWGSLADADRPLRTALIAAVTMAVVGGVLLAGIVAPRRPVMPSAPRATADLALVHFELDAPGAAGVTLVGDFNDWDPAATPMQRDPSRDTWSVSLPVTHGRHVYGFVVDRMKWLPDPRAPLAPGDGFGSKSSVIVVTGPGT